MVQQEEAQHIIVIACIILMHLVSARTVCGSKHRTEKPPHMLHQPRANAYAWPESGISGGILCNSHQPDPVFSALTISME